MTRLDSSRLFSSPSSSRSVVRLLGWPFGGDESSASSPPFAVEGATVTQEPAPPGATDVPHEPLAGDNCGPERMGRSWSANQIVSYYGNPYAEHSAHPWQHEPDELASMLKERAHDLDALNGFRGCSPRSTSCMRRRNQNPREWLYSIRCDDTSKRISKSLAGRVSSYSSTCRSGEVTSDGDKKVFPYLKASNVHVAIDPEFTMGPGEVPGQVIGHVDAAQINLAQQTLEDFAAQNGLASKILIVHQFDAAMITDPENIASFPHVQVVVDMDGFGPKETKIRKFGFSRSRRTLESEDLLQAGRPGDDRRRGAATQSRRDHLSVDARRRVLTRRTR